MQSSGGTILITGSSGVLGTAVAAELSSGYDVLCLRHRTAVDRPGVREIAADLTAPGLGLSAVDRDLVSSTDVIVHCAATTSFHNDRTKMSAVNIVGTQRILDLAAATGARLVHLSTAFVARHQPELEDEPLLVRGPAAYVESKVAAETLVRSSGLPSMTVRPSVVIGDSRTGEIRKAQGLHALCGAMMRSEVPLLGIRPTSLVDCIPQERVAMAIRRLIDRGVPTGEIWLTAGDQALTAREVIDLALAVGVDADLRPARFRMVDPEMVNRLLLPMVADPALKRLRRRFEEMSALMELFAQTEPFPSTWEVADPQLRPDHDELVDALDLSLRWWAEREGLFETEGVA